MKANAAVRFTVALFAATLLAQEPRPEKTDKLLNGRAWIEMNAGEKTAWLSGFYDAALLWEVDVRVLQRDTLPKNFKDTNAMFANFPKTLTFGEIGKSLDGFYAEPLNRHIAICYALDWVSFKAKGVSDRILKEWETAARARAANAL